MEDLWSKQGHKSYGSYFFFVYPVMALARLCWTAKGYLKVLMTQYYLVEKLHVQTYEYIHISYRKIMYINYIIYSYIHIYIKLNSCEIYILFCFNFANTFHNNVC